MTNKETAIVGLECTECGQKQTMKVAKKDAKLQNRINYLCKDLGGITDNGCSAVTEQIINHIYGEPAASRLRELRYD